MTEEKPTKIYRAKPTPGAKPVESPATQPGAVREGQRIAKLLARAGVASRREIERMIDAGRIELNGDLVEHPSLLLKNLTGITVDGKPVAEPSPAKLYRFHKPNGCLTAERDFSGKKTIYDVLPEME
ncbi:MAG: S4 domain-containing protein, partial [Parasphingorhabdus sp.]